MFNFDIKKTQVSKSLKLWSFPLIMFADTLAALWFCAFAASLALILSSFLGIISFVGAVKISAICFSAFIVFFELYLFSESVVKVLQPEFSLADALAQPDNYNLAEFLNLEACSMVETAIAICKKRVLSEISSEALLYAALQKSEDVRLLMTRLGIDAKKTTQDIKNDLEKQPRQPKFQMLFSATFEATILEAATMASARGLKTISEKELLAALAKHDSFFKKVLLEIELKEKDVENLAFWLAALENTKVESSKFWTKENLAKYGSLGKSFASGFTPILDQFSIDWTRATIRGATREIIGHAKEIGEVETALATSSHKNALIVGLEGSGRKSIAQAICQRAAFEQSLPELNNRRMIQLDMVSLLAKIQDPEKVEATLNTIFEEVVSSENVILVIDNLENFVDNKIVKPGTIDITGILAKYLAMAEFQCIGITSFDGLHRKLENNPSFLEYFRKVEVSEISEFETIQLLQALALGMEKKHTVMVLYPAIREIINLTSRYLPSLPFPKKAIDVLQEAVAQVKSSKEKVVEARHIASIISARTQIPVGKMEFKEKSVLLNLENLIHERIINQKEAVSEIAIAMRRARSGISNKKRPMGVFLFLGPTGVGKTETAKALAQIYFGSEEKMIRLDMSEFQAVSDIPRLLGSMGENPEQGILTTPVRENPFSLVLLDEIEKAHKDILNLFLQVFDDGYVNDGQGRKVSFSNTIIICTSNAGAPEIFKSVEAGAIIERDTLLDILFEKAIFKPELVNRFDASIIFHPLTKENLMDISQLMFVALAKNLKEKEIELVITQPLKEKIVELSYKPQFGAREMRRVMQDKVENNIADALLKDTIVKGDKIEINPENFKVVVIK